MTDHTAMMSNDSNSTWYDGEDGPSLHTRLAFAGTWMLIAVAGILGKERPLPAGLDRLLFLVSARQQSRDLRGHPIRKAEQCHQLLHCQS